jgi:hypothetical protein
VLAGCGVLLAACERPPTPGDESPQIAAAKAAIARRLNSTETAAFRDVVEYRDGVVCGEFNGKRMFTGSDMGFRKFVYNAPEPGALAIDRGDLSREDLSYWCSEQPDKRLRMLAASAAELAQACQAAGGKSPDICRLAASQKATLEELQAQAGHAPAAPGSAAVARRAPEVSAAPLAAASVPGPSVPVASAPVASAPGPAAASPQAPAGNAQNAIPSEVEAALQNWRERWQQGDVEGYLRMYEASFTGSAGSHAEWAQQRRQKMKNVHPTIGIERLQAVRVTPQEVEVRFIQAYAARQHQDRGIKTMVFRRSPQGWLVADERWEVS